MSGDRRRESAERGDRGTSRRSFMRAAGLGAGALALGGTGVAGSALAADPPYNLAHALQQSLYFFDANRCGPDVTGGRLEWRGDCHTHDTEIPLDAAPMESGTNLSASFVEEHRDVLDPEGTGTVDLSGGFHDAGDHVKFGLPQNYTASTLAWAVYEFEESFRAVGSYDHARSHLREFAEFFRESTFRDENGDVVAFCHQVGNGQEDHNYWGPPELQTLDTSARPAYFATAENPASDQAGGAAAALAAIATVLEDEDAAFAEACLDDARALYEFATENRGLAEQASQFYPTTGDADQLAWAGMWLHLATGEQSYLEDVAGTDGTGNYTGFVGDIIDSTDDFWNNEWVHSWDTVWSGVFLLLAEVTDDQQWWDLSRWNLEYWSGGEVPHEDGSGGYVQTTPAGFSWLNQWGSARYNAAAQMQAMVFHRHRDRQDFADWAHGQMQYIMGDNPFDYSLIVGFTDDHAEHPHHDAAHGSTSGVPGEPPEHEHTLWGALVGGPGSDDSHVDETSDYVHNEVAIDYNVGLVGALAGLYEYAGQGSEPVADFPPDEDPIDPYYVEANVDTESDGRIDIRAYVTNESIHPPHREDGLSFRYFIDASQIEAAGGSVDDISVEITYDQLASQEGSGVTVSGPHAWNEAESVYYFEFDYAGVPFYGSKEISFALAAYTLDGFDPSTDPSRQALSAERQRVEAMPVYRDGELVYGSEPGGGEPEPTEPSPPRHLAVSETGETSLALSWSAPETVGEGGLTGYRVVVGGRSPAEVDPSATTYTATDLDPDTNYEVLVSARNAAGESEFRMVTASTDPEQTEPGLDPVQGTVPQDSDGDGYHEDFNANEKLDSDDVVRFFNNYDDPAVTENAAAYDFNDSGDVDFDDIVRLFNQL